MDSADAITLQAFMLALVQLDVPLSPELHEAVNQVGDALTHHRPEVAEEVRSLVQQHWRLKELYDVECQNLQELYPTQQRAKRLNGYISGHHHNDPEAITWNDIAAAVLKQDDFRAGAEALLKRAHAQGDAVKASGDVKVFLSALQRAVAQAHAQAIAILKAIEKRPLTPRNLPHVVGLSVDQSRSIVEYLWKEGYIDRFTGNFFSSLSAMFGGRHRENETIDPDTYLTLTSKGHFLLHPVFIIGRREDRYW
ncbi:hypothetical protein ACQ4M4_13840 [Leptolyngbya sp. AN02str]|uniref:hypothetical protein n=1 Tax=Leptolyngbya sp. AN02str TaxID=3423363 RepID=UPI003D3227E1